MNRIKKITAIGLASLITISTLGLAGLGITPTAQAQMYDWGTMNRYDRMWWRDRDRDYDRDRDHHRYRDSRDRHYFRRNLFTHRPIIFSTHRDFFGRYGYNPYQFRNPLVPRVIVVVDRSNPHNVLVFSNQITGPFSTNVNTARIWVDRDSFRSLSRNINIDQNIDISVDTGGNVVSFNTIVGDITTGDVSIDIN